MEELPNCVRSLYGKELERIGLNGNNVSLPFLGTLLSVTEACDIAFGKMDPITKVILVKIYFFTLLMKSVQGAFPTRQAISSSSGE